MGQFDPAVFGAGPYSFRLVVAAVIDPGMVRHIGSLLTLFKRRGWF